MTTTVRILENVVPGRRLGRHVEHDERSRAFAFAPAAPLPLRAVVWRRYGTALDQGSIGSCTGNALAGVLNTVPFHVTGTKLKTETDALAIYSAATVIDGFPGQWPPSDTGSSGLAVCKAAQQAGLISGYQWAFGIDEALQALMHGPVITGINWYSGFDTPDKSGKITIFGSVRGGHEVEVNGYNPATGLVRCWNSWGQWGVGGRFYMPVSVWDRLLRERGDVTIPVLL